ncbi:hypothetical protein ACFFIX_06475 [Metabacillus herbersteinensis]|uniref:Uncharacterized protein n=1 Tax=Metabacillus herbersteinensis TaxID=283816 RepID=A0ABV6GBP6_9BACI
MRIKPYRYGINNLSVDHEENIVRGFENPPVSLKSEKEIEDYRFGYEMALIKLGYEIVEREEKNKQ